MLSEAKQTGGKISMALGLMYMRTMHLHIALHVKGLSSALRITCGSLSECENRIIMICVALGLRSPGRGPGPWAPPRGQEAGSQDLGDVPKRINS